MGDEVTQLLGRWSRAEPDAAAELFATVYDELRRLARRALRGERRDHTLQPTALVNEAFLRLAPQHSKDWQSRSHFFAISAQVMRQVLIDHARRRLALKRGSGPLRIALEEASSRGGTAKRREVDLLHLDRALEELAELDAHRARVVELRYFSGMTLAEIGLALERPEWEVKKDWMLAKAWLARRLKGAP
jgi:RNA polymerase sigma factor (TIGR02999 family)